MSEQQHGPGWVPVPNEESGGDRHPVDRVSPDQIGDDGTWPMQSASGPCRTWPVAPGCGCLPPDAKTWTPDQQHAVEASTEILWRLTAGRFGLCRETVRPCRRDCLPDACGGMPVPTLVGGQWLNLDCGHGRSCGCSPIDEILLPSPVYWEPPVTPPANHPEQDPDEEPTPPPVPSPPRYGMKVWIDGTPISGPNGAYWLMDGNRLMRTDGGTWPQCQDLTRPIDQPGTFGIQYWRGQPVPAAGRRAVALLACELWKACNGSSDCKLPARVQQVQREGISMTMLDSQEFLDKGRTGVTEVDLWLSAVNPYGHRQPAGVYSPDGPNVRSEWTTGQHPGRR